MSEVMYKKTIPLYITIVLALVQISDFFIKIPVIETTASTLRTWGALTSAFTIPLAVSILLMYHITQVRKREEGRWGFSVLTIALVSLFVIVGLTMGIDSTSYQLIFRNIYSGVVAVGPSLFVFWMSSAAYRAFKVRNIESFLLMISAVIWSVAVGMPSTMAIWPALGDFGMWWVTVPQLGPSRGMNMALAVGSMIVIFRQLFGLGRGYESSEG